LKCEDNNKYTKQKLIVIHHIINPAPKNLQPETPPPQKKEKKKHEKLLLRKWRRLNLQNCTEINGREPRPLLIHPSKQKLAEYEEEEIENEE